MMNYVCDLNWQTVNVHYHLEVCDFRPERLKVNDKLYAAILLPIKPGGHLYNPTPNSWC